MSKRIAVVNQKGGVAKTTTVINLASSLVELGKQVLVIDLDPQANLTEGLPIEKEINNTVYEILKNEIETENVIYKTEIDGLDIIPSNINLTNADIELSNEIGRETILNEALDNAAIDYDYIFMDCSPSLSLLPLNALSASDSIIIPLEPAMFGLNGIDQLVKVFKLIKKKINTALEIEGVLLTRVDARTNIAKEFEEELREIFGDKIFNTMIHQNVKIAESQTERVPVNLYDSNARGAKEYMKLAKELIDNE